MLIINIQNLELLTTREFNLENYFETYDVITVIGLLEFITEDEAIKLQMIYMLY